MKKKMKKIKMATDVLTVAINKKIRRGSITNYFIFVNVNNTAPTTTTPMDIVIPPTKKLF